MVDRVLRHNVQPICTINELASDQRMVKLRASDRNRLLSSCHPSHLTNWSSLYCGGHSICRQFQNQYQ